jgi:type II secretion system protein C
MKGRIFPLIALWSIPLFGAGAGPGPELVLDGVIVAQSPADSVALVRRAGGGRAQVLRVGQELHGYLLVEVTKGFIRLQGEEGELRLFLGRASDSTGPSDSRALSDEGRSKDGAGSEWIRRAFPRAVARERLSKEIPVILSETDLTPRIEDGEIRGLSVTRLPDGTLLSECGLLPGDVLVSINGEPLVGVEALWEMIARLVDQEEIRVVVRRRDEVLKLAYAFTN